MLCHIDLDSSIMVRLSNDQCCLFHAISGLTRSRGGTKFAWDSAGVLAPLILGVALLIAFLVVEIKVAPLPIIPSAYICLYKVGNEEQLD